MVAKIDVFKKNESRVFGVLSCNASLEMRLSKHNSGKSIAKLGLKNCKGFWAGKKRLWKVAAGYDGASVLVESMHGQLVSFTALCEKALFAVGAGQQ